LLWFGEEGDAILSLAILVEDIVPFTADETPSTNVVVKGTTRWNKSGRQTGETVHHVAALAPDAYPT
jgi:hypothetical protein